MYALIIMLVHFLTPHLVPTSRPRTVCVPGRQKMILAEKLNPRGTSKLVL